MCGTHCPPAIIDKRSQRGEICTAISTVVRQTNKETQSCIRQMIEKGKWMFSLEAQFIVGRKKDVLESCVGNLWLLAGHDIGH